MRRIARKITLISTMGLASMLALGVHDAAAQVIGKI